MKLNNAKDLNYEEVGSFVATYYEEVQIDPEFSGSLLQQFRTAGSHFRQSTLQRNRFRLALGVSIAAALALGIHFSRPPQANHFQPKGNATASVPHPGIANEVKPDIAIPRDASAAQMHASSGNTNSGTTASVQSEYKPKMQSSQAGNEIAFSEHSICMAVYGFRGQALDGQGHPLKVGAHLSGDFTVQTGESARLDLITRRGTQLCLAQETELSVAHDGKATIKKGRLYCRNRQGEIHSIETPNGSIQLLGTILDTEVVHNGPTYVTVVEGKVKLANSHGQSLVGAGRKATLLADAMPVPGTAVNPSKETSWYDGCGQLLSDSGQIAYAFSRQMIPEIWVMNADGTDKHRVKSYTPGALTEAFFVPGQQSVAIFQQNRIYLLNLPTGQDTEIQLPVGWLVSSTPTFSPDGRKLAVFAFRENSTDMDDQRLFIRDLTVGESRDFGVNTCAGSPSWSRDGRFISFSEWPKDKPCSDEIAILDTQTYEIRHTGIKAPFGGTFSPDGSKLAFLSYEKGVKPSPSMYGISVVDLKSGSKRVLASSHCSGCPIWSSDGRRILFTTEEPSKGATSKARFRVCIAQADGSSCRIVYDFKASQLSWGSAWSSDQKSVYIRTDKAVLKIAADGSGLFADLGGNETDSILPQEEASQTRGAIEQVEKADTLIGCMWSGGYGYIFKGQFAKAKISYRSAADTLAEIPWKYPLSQISVNDLFQREGELRRIADSTKEELLAMSCRFRMDSLHMSISQYLCKYGHLPPNLKSLRRFVEAQEASFGALVEADRLIFACPQKHTPYIYHAAGKPHFKAGDLLISCPNHPNNSVKANDGDYGFSRDARGGKNR